MAILKADPEYRRKCLLLYGALAAVGLALAHWGAPLLKAWILGKELSEAIRLLQVLLGLMGLPLLLMAYYSYRLARKAIASSQFPPPGMKVLRDTEILEGPAARRKGRQLWVVSIALALIAVIGSVYLPYLAGQLDHNTNPQSVSLSQP
ncbi:MAG: hypothetical protein QNJ46_16515 [Leptolyngbyaceae cyanobacterium MO_188.B28]|nr:hypothetical protein [Leptolyngbyaceae cyanobacterium MO_188.B28]